MRALAPLLWLLLCYFELVSAGSSKRKKQEDAAEKKVLMAHHSFQAPLQYEELLNDWAVSGSSLVEGQRMLLHPSVSERMGFVWSKMPLLTNNFEAIFHFKVVGPKETEKIALDQSFAFWYVQDNVAAEFNETKLIKAASWAVGLQDTGYTLSGFKSKFTGFGAVFTNTNKDKKPKATVSFIENEDKELKIGVDVPTASGKAIDFRNTLNNAQMKIRVTPTSIEGHLKQSPSLSWNECFKIDKTANPVKTGGYIGFSAWSGTAPKPEGDQVANIDLISIQQLDLNNFDETSIGEEMKDVSKEIQEAYRQMLTDENRHFVDQKSQTEHLDRLTKMIIQHMDTSKPVDDGMFQQLEDLQGRVGKLDEDCKTVTQEIAILVEQNGTEETDHAAQVGAVKDKIIGLRRLFVKDSAAHKKKLDVVQKTVAEVKEKRASGPNAEALTAVTVQTEALENTVVTRRYHMSWMLLTIVGSVAAVGCLMYSRMNYYERKHFL